jgi:hypothetical protein
METTKQASLLYIKYLKKRELKTSTTKNNQPQKEHRKWARKEKETTKQPEHNVVAIVVLSKQNLL